MKRITSWIRAAVTPSPQEIKRVENIIPSEVMTYCREATQPSEAEINAVCLTQSSLMQNYRSATNPDAERIEQLIANLPKQTHSPTWRPTRIIGASGAGVLALAALVLFFVARPSGYGTSPLEVGISQQVASVQILEFGPSIQLQASASLMVMKADEERTVIRLKEGSTHFEVKPDGAYRDLTVEAGNVLITVKGTVFDVERDGDLVQVYVERGAVQIDYNEQSHLIAGGFSWSNAEWLAKVVTRPAAPVEIAPAAAPGDHAITLLAKEIKPDTTKRPRAKTQAEPTPAPPAFTLNISEDTLAFHEVMTAKDKGLSHDDLNQLVEDFVTTYPSSLHRNTALEIRLQSVIATQEPRAAVSAITDWMNSEKEQKRLKPQREIHYRTIRATLLRDALNNCEDALPDYRYLVERTQEPQRSETLAWLGLCASGIGDIPGSRRAFSRLNTGLLPTDLMQRVRERRIELDTLP